MKKCSYCEHVFEDGELYIVNRYHDMICEECVNDMGLADLLDSAPDGCNTNFKLLEAAGTEVHIT